MLLKWNSCCSPFLIKAFNVPFFRFLHSHHHQRAASSDPTTLPCQRQKWLWQMTIFLLFAFKASFALLKESARIISIFKLSSSHNERSGEKRQTSVEAEYWVDSASCYYYAVQLTSIYSRHKQTSSGGKFLAFLLLLQRQRNAINFKTFSALLWCISISFMQMISDSVLILKLAPRTRREEASETSSHCPAWSIVK